MRLKRGIQLCSLLLTLPWTSMFCGVADAADSPRAAFKKYHAALKNKDGAALRAMVSKDDLRVLEESGLRADTLLLAAADRAPAKIPETRNERINGDTATLEYREGDRWETLRFVKEDGTWKISVGE